MKHVLVNCYVPITVLGIEDRMGAGGQDNLTPALLGLTIQKEEEEIKKL